MWILVRQHIIFTDILLDLICVFRQKSIADIAEVIIWVLTFWV